MARTRPYKEILVLEMMLLTSRNERKMHNRSKIAKIQVKVLYTFDGHSINRLQWIWYVTHPLPGNKIEDTLSLSFAVLWCQAKVDAEKC